MNIEEGVPDPPEGYQSYAPDFDPTGAVGPWIGLVSYFVAISVFLGLLALRFRQSAVFVFEIFLLMSVMTVIPHEAAHAVVGWATGARLTVGITDEGWLDSFPYVLAHGEFLTYWESMLSYAAPLLFTTPICLLFMAVRAS